MQEKIAIGEQETAGELHETMMQVGADLLLQTVDAFSTRQLQAVPQSALVGDPNENLHHAPKIFTANCEIDWQKNIDQIYNLIRGLSPYPGAFTFFQNKKMKILAAIKEPSMVHEHPGAFVTDHKKYLKFAAKDGYLSVTALQLEGKKKMGVEEFLRGWRNGQHPATPASI